MHQAVQDLFGSAIPASPSAGEVRAQLDRILSSGEFVAPERARNFLRYVVEETLAGRAARIKAYTIAIEVFDRDDTFDALNDPAVRIEAGRLRRALERYYLVAGQDDPILIDIPKGAYVPVFTRAPLRTENEGATEAKVSLSGGVPEASTRSRQRALGIAGLALAACLLGLAYFVAWQWQTSPARVAGNTGLAGPTLVVIPFKHLGETPEGRLYAIGLTEELLAKLVRFKEVTVLGRETSMKIGTDPDLAHLHRDLGVRYAVDGNIRVSGDRMRVIARVVDAAHGTVLWSGTYDNDGTSRNIIEVQDNIAGNIATAIAQPYGVIFRADARRSWKAPDDEAYLCTLTFYAYRSAPSASSHARVRECLTKAVARAPGYATAWAMLSVINLDEDRFGFNRGSAGSEPLRRALDFAHRAVALDPDNARAMHALVLSLFFNQEISEGRRVGERALALNPNDPELLGDYGTRIAQAGDWARGIALVEQALARNPGNSSFYRAMFAIGAYFRCDLDRAVDEIRQADLKELPLFHAVAAIIYAERGLISEAEQARVEFLRWHPHFFDNIDVELAKRNYRPADQARLIEGARKAGFRVPDKFGGRGDQDRKPIVPPCRP